MRRLIMQQWISLDGYVADRDDTLNFFTTINPEKNKFADEHQLRFLDKIDLILLGRKTYSDLFEPFWPNTTNDQEIIAERLNEIPKIVFSRTLKAAPWGKWEPARVVPNPLEEIVKLKNQPGKNIVIWGSVSICQLFMKERLIDEIDLRLCPVITGGGRKLFTEQSHYSYFDLKETKNYDNGGLFLNYHLK